MRFRVFDAWHSCFWAFIGLLLLSSDYYRSTGLFLLTFIGFWEIGYFLFRKFVMKDSPALVNELDKSHTTSTWKEVKSVVSTDGKHRILIMTAYGNMFRYDEEKFITYEEYSGWAQSKMSGLYDSAEAAERDARMAIPWLRDQDSK